MRQGVSRLLDNRKLDRRQFVQGLVATATAALAASAPPKAGAGCTGFKAVAYNHISYNVPSVAQCRDFYVKLFGMKVVYDDGKQCSLHFGDPPNALYLRPLKPDHKPPSGAWAAQMGQGYVDHLAFSIENYDREAVKAELTRRGLDPKPDGPVTWMIRDPSGFPFQICPLQQAFPGAALPGAQESSGTRNLSALPQPDAQSYKAYAISHLALHVPDVRKNRDFYMDLLGMELIYYKPGDMFGIDSYRGGPICFLKFGENSLYLRRSNDPEHKPYVAHFSPAVENYDQAVVKADLIRRGFNPEPDSKYGWSIHDPAGMRTEVAGWGLRNTLRVTATVALRDVPEDQTRRHMNEPKRRHHKSH